MVLGKECQRSPATGRPVSREAGEAHRLSDEGRWLDRSICGCAWAQDYRPLVGWSRSPDGHLRTIAHWPEFLAARAFAAFDGDAVAALLVELPTPSAVRSKSPFEIARLLAAQRYRRRPLERGERVVAAAQVGPRPQEAVYGRLVAEVAGELRELKLRIEALDEEIRDRFLRQPEAPIILSLPGISYRTGPRFLAEVGALARFGSPDALAAYAGLTPPAWQSGRSSGTHFLTRRCNPHLRQACWSAALGSLKTPASRRFYDRKRSEGKSHHQAVIALARTQLRVLWTMLRAGTLFSAERALQAA